MAFFVVTPAVLTYIAAVEVGVAVAALIGVGTVSTVAATAIGAATIGAVFSAVKGDKPEDIFKNAVLGGITSYVGGTIGQQVSQTVSTSVAQNLITSGVSQTTANAMSTVLGKAASAALTGGTSALLQGRNPIEAMLKSGLTATLSGGVGLAVDKITGGIPGFSDLSSTSSGAALSRATNSAIAASILGNNAGQSFSSSLIDSFVKTVGPDIKNGLKDAGAALKDSASKVFSAQDEINNNVIRQQSISKDYETNISPLQKEQNAAQTAIDEFNNYKNKYDNYDTIYHANNIHLSDDVWNKYARPVWVDNQGNRVPDKGYFLGSANAAAETANNLIEKFNANYEIAKPTLDKLNADFTSTKEIYDTLKSGLDNTYQPTLDNALNNFNKTEYENTALISEKLQNYKAATDKYKELYGQDPTPEDMALFIKSDTTDYVKAVEEPYLLRRATAAGFPDLATSQQYDGNFRNYAVDKENAGNEKQAKDAGWPDYATLMEWNGSKAAYDAHNEQDPKDAQDAIKAQAAKDAKLVNDAKVTHDPQVTHDAQVARDAEIAKDRQAEIDLQISNAKTAKEQAAAILAQEKLDAQIAKDVQEAKDRQAVIDAQTELTNKTNFDTELAIAAGFPDLATSQQYGGNRQNYFADKENVANEKNAKRYGWPDYATLMEWNGSKAAYDAAVSLSAISGKDGAAVKLTDKQVDDLLAKQFIFEGGDFNTKQDAARAAKLAGYTKFEYDNSIYTMTTSVPTEKAVFQAVIDDAPNKKEAFRLARSLLGANQIFDYKGNKITTETLEERNARQYNSEAAIQARVDLIPASSGSINTRTGTPANVSNTFIDQKTNQVVEDTRVWDKDGKVVSGNLSGANRLVAMQVAGSLILDAGTQMVEAFSGVGKFLGLIDKDSALAQNINQLVSFNEAQKPPAVKEESAKFWANVKNAQGIGNTIDVVLSSVVDQPLMTGFNVASEVLQTMGTLGTGAGVKYASKLLKAAPALAAKYGIGTDIVLNIGESAGAAYNESYKKAVLSVGAQVRDGSMTAADAEAYAADTASKTFLAAAGITGAVLTIIPGGNALAKQVLGSGAENAAMKTTFKEALKSDAANVGYKFAAGTTLKETVSEGGEAGLIEAASQKILSPDADYNWKDIVVTSMLESIYGGGHSAVIAAADVAVSNFKDKLIASGVDKTEVESLTNKVADLVKSGDVSDASIAAIKTETENLFENVGLRIDPTLDLMSDQFLSGVISQEVAGELSEFGLSATQIAQNLPNAIAHIESGSKIDPTYTDQFLTDSGEARQIAQNLGYVNPSQEVLDSLTGPISEADAQAKLSDFLQSMSAFEANKLISPADAQEMVKDLGLTTMSDADAISLATKIVQSVPTDKLAPDPNIQLASDAGFPDVTTYIEYGGDKAAYDKVQTDIANLQAAEAAGFPDFASYVQYGGNVKDYNKTQKDAANLVKAETAGFPDYASYTRFDGDLTDYNKANEDAANIRKATIAGFPDYANFLQYNGNIADYSTAKAAESNRLTALIAGFPDFASYIKFNGDIKAYNTEQTNATNLAAAKAAGFPDYENYNLYKGDINALNTTNKNAANLTTAKAAGFPDYAAYTQYKGDVTAYNNAITAAANAQKATDAGFPDYATYTQYNGNKAVYTAALSDASNTALATKAGFPDFNTYKLYSGDKKAYDTALTNTANTQKATAAGFPNYAAYTQYNGDVKAYNADSAAKIAGWKDAAEQTKANTAGYKEPAAYATYLTNTANTQKATTAGFPDYVTYSQFNGDSAAYNSSKLTAETTKAINNAIAGIQFPAGITAADVAAQVKAALAANPNLTVPDVTGSIAAYMTANPGLSAADVNTAIAAATKDLSTKKDIETAISGIKFPTGITAADVSEQITEALKANPGLSAADATKAITTYMTDNPGLSAADVSTVIGTATKDLVSTKTFNTAIESLGTDVKTKFDALTEGQQDIVKAYTKQGVDINKAIDDSAKLNTEQITNVKTQLTTLTGDVEIKFDALTKSQQDIVTSQIQLGVDVNKAIDDAAKTTSEQITNVRTDLTKDITNVQTQFNARVDELVLQGKTYQEATQEALKELGSGVSGLQTNVADIKKQQDAEAKAKKAAEDKAKTQGGLSAAMSLIAPAAASAVSDDTPYRQIGLKTTGDSKFEGPLEQYLKMVREGDYSPKPKQQDTPQQNQQVAPVQDKLSTPQPQPQEGSDYFNYGQQTDINDLLGGGKAPELPFKAGGLATPLFAGGGTTRHGRYAGGGLNVIHHSGKPRLDFRTGNAVTGPGDGQSDDIPAMLADGEFVFPADVVAALGNGSTKAGSDKLYDMMHSIRAYHRSAKPKDLPPPAKKSPLDYLKKRTARR